MKKRLTPIIVMLISIFYFPNNTLAQTPTPNTYFNTESSFTSAPVSPNAAAAGLHAIVPRNLSMGLPGIDIPVCMLEDVDISVPVTLQYHPDAVKPDEHPGWVGLGWNLQAGGSIVRVTKGQHDEASGGYYLNYHNDDALNSDWFGTPDLPTNENFEDYEPDEFIFNFAGYSGKFYYNHLGEWVFTTNSGEHFEMSIADSPVNTFNLLGSDFGDTSLAGSGEGFYSFTITANDGTKYTFGGTSNSVEYTRTVVKDINGNYLPNVYEIFPTTWHLTSIESINGNIVNLAYQRYGAIFKKSQNFNLYNEYDCNLGCGTAFTYPTNVSNCYYAFYDVRHIIYPSYLSNITGTDGNVIEFTLDDSNQDNYGNIKILNLDENIYSKYPKLTKITAKRDGNTEKEMELIYNDESAIANRLMLNEVYETDNSNNRLPGYQFNYNTTDMPDYHSFEVDHWGYYNGVALFTPSSGQLGCPSFSNPDEYKNSMDMLPDENLSKASILEGITYPMGGYKEFVYEQNTSFKEVQKNYGASGTESGYPNFTLANITSGKDVGGLRIQAINTYESPSATNLLTTKTYTYESSGILDFTSYGIEEGYFVDANEQRYWNIHHNNVNTLRQMSNRHICYSIVRETQADGGYRILNYSNFDKDLSGGTNLTDEKPLAHTAQLNPNSAGPDLYLRTHTAPYSSRNRERGKLLEEDIHRADGTQLRNTKNTYTALNTESAYQVRAINRHYGSIGDVLPTARVLPSYSNARATAYYEYIYPVHLTAQQVTQYDESGTNGRVTTRSFAYDYATNDGDLTDDNNLRETVITNSDSKVYKTTYIYTTDYNFQNNTPTGKAAEAIEYAVENNIFLPVETLRYLGSDVIGGQITTYQMFDPNNTCDTTDPNNTCDIVPYQTYRLTFPDTDGNLDMITDLAESNVSSGTFNMDTRYELYTTYEEYSSTGIPKQSTQDGGTPNSILLSDDELLTMASVTNAKYTDIAYTGFEEYGDGNWLIINDNKVTSIFGEKAGDSPSRIVAGLSPGTYQVSFWSDSGSGYIKVDDILNGDEVGVPVVHTADNGWSYHSLRVNLNIGVFFQGTGTIDELRIHPADALMTTSTYDPVTHQTLVTVDENGKPMFYEYDDFERVVAMRDQDGNLVTDYEYKYRETDNVNQNYVRTNNHWIQGATAGTGTNNNRVQSTQYTDGLGRPLQSIVTAKSPQQKDIIQLREYDNDGREPKNYLPFTQNGTGNFIANATAIQQLFHSNTSGVAQTSPAYRETGFEASPMSRSKLMRPEGSYQSTPVTLEYNVGLSGLPDVKDFKISNTGDVSIISTFSLTDLNNTRQIDENNNVTFSYTDKLGRTILSRQQNTDSGGNTIYHDTYTVYDNFGNVRYMVPPEAVKQLDDGFAWTSNNVQDLVYEYRYDRRERLIYKRIPAAEAEEYVYDYLDRVILMQDGNRKAAGEWLFTKYDALGRVILSGIYQSASGRSALQLSAKNFYTTTGDASNLFETPTPGTIGYTLTTSFPQLFSNYTIHTINYYNNYDFNQDNIDDVTFVADI